MKKATILAIVAILISGVSFASEPSHENQSDGHHAEEAHHDSAAAHAVDHHGDAEHGTEDEGFNAGEMIMHHISDAHQMHFFTLRENTDDEKHIYLGLPVILLDDGLKMFSSRKFYDHHDHDAHLEGGHVYRHEDYYLIYSKDGEKIYNTNEWKDTNGIVHALDTPAIVQNEEGKILNTAPMDFSITKSVFGLIIALLITCLLFIRVARWYKKNKNTAPKGLAAVLEPLILFVRDDIAIPSLGAKQAQRFMPFLMTIFFFIWVANIMGLIPMFGFNVMGTLGVTLVLAGIVFIISTAVSNKHFWGHTLNPSGVPLPIKFILVPIEIAGLFIRPAVLMIRLTANITAGHIIILAFTSLIFIFGQGGNPAGYGVGVGSVAFMIFMFFIELLVAFLQAYVFTLLSAMYFGMATEEAHH